MDLLVKNWWRPGRRLPMSRSRAQALIRKLLQAEGIDPRCEISVLFCDEEQMRELNRHYMGEDYATDVLAFPQGERFGVRGSAVGSDRSDESDRSDRSEPRTPNPEPLLLGDIAICGPVAERQAEAAGHSAAAEVEWLLLHATLHLLGYDDAT